MRKIAIITLILLLTGLTAAEPWISDVNIDPQTPEAGEQIEVTATGEDAGRITFLQADYGDGWKTRYCDTFYTCTNSGDPWTFSLSDGESQEVQVRAADSDYAYSDLSTRTVSIEDEGERYVEFTSFPSTWAEGESGNVEAEAYHGDRAFDGQTLRIQVREMEGSSYGPWRTVDSTTCNSDYPGTRYCNLEADFTPDSTNEHQMIAWADTQSGEQVEERIKFEPEESDSPDDGDEEHRLTVNVEDDGVGLEDATVEVDGEEKTTNSAGNARFDLKDNYYQVEASKSEYDSDSEGVRIDGSDESVTLELDREEDEDEGEVEIDSVSASRYYLEDGSTELRADVDNSKDSGEWVDVEWYADDILIAETSNYVSPGDEEFTKDRSYEYLREQGLELDRDYELKAKIAGEASFKSSGRDLRLIGDQIDQDEAFFDVEITDVSDAVVGESLEVEYYVENTGEQDDTKDVKLFVSNVQRDSVSQYVPGEGSRTGTLQWDTISSYTGQRTVKVVTIDDDEDTTTINVRDNGEDEKHRLTVNVEDDGVGLEDATVEVDGEEKTTNSAGNARFDLEDGYYTVEASKNDYSTDKENVRIDGSDESLNLELVRKQEDEKHRLTVNVKDSYGDRLENAEAEVNGDEKATNSYGRARFDLEDGYYTVEASKSGYDSDSEGVRIDGSDESVTLELDREEDEDEGEVEIDSVSASRYTLESDDSTNLRASVENNGGSDEYVSVDWYAGGNLIASTGGTVDSGERETFRKYRSFSYLRDEGLRVDRDYELTARISGEAGSSVSSGRDLRLRGDQDYDPEEAFFEIEITDVDPVTEGETLEVDYRVENTGEQSGRTEVVLEALGIERDSVSRYVPRDEGSRTGTLEWDTSVDDSGLRRIKLVTEDDTDSEDVRIYSREDDGDLDLTSVSASRYTLENDDSTTLRATVENNGGSDEYVNVDWYADNILVASSGATIDAGDERDLEKYRSFSYLRDQGLNVDRDYRLRAKITGQDNFQSSGRDLRLLGAEDDDPEEAFFDVEITGTNSPVDEGEPLEVDYLVENTGEEFARKDVDLEINGVEEDSVSRGLSSGASRTGTLVWDSTIGNSGSVNVRLATEDDSDSITARVNAVEESYDLDVHVEDQDGELVEDALVTADGEDQRTDSVGEASFNLREGDYRVVASKQSYLPESRRIYLDRDRQITLVLDSSSSDVEAEFDYIPSKPEVEEEIEFDASRSGGDIVDYRWSFGDGDSGNGREVEHSYESGGWYSVNLRVESGDGETDSTTRSIYVEEEEQEPGELDVEVEDEEDDPVDDARVTAMALSPYNYAVRSSDVDTDSERTSSSRAGDYSLGFELDGDRLETDAGYSSGYDRVSWSGTVLESSDGEGLVVRYDLSADSRRGTYRKYEASQDIDLSSGEKEVTMILTVNGDVLEEYTSVIDVPDDHRFEAENTGTGTDYSGRDTRISTPSNPFFSRYTDRDGEAFFEVPEGRYLVTGSKPGYTSDRTTVSVEEGGRRNIDLELEELRDDSDDEDDDPYDDFDEEILIDEIRMPSSVCEGDSFTARVEVENTGEEDMAYSLSATGLGTETDRVYYLDEGESHKRTVTFSNVQGSGNERVSFSTGYDSRQRTVQVRDCDSVEEDSGLSASVNPKQIRIGDSIRVSGIAEGTGSQDIDIGIGRRSAASISSEPDGRFSTYIIPERVGNHQVIVESGGATSSTAVQVLPTVAVTSVNVPNNIFEGEDFEVCGNIESQTAPLVLLKKDGKVIDSKNGRGEVCFEVNEEPGTYSYEVQALNRGASNTGSRTVEVMEQDSEVRNFPDQIASVESGSGMVKVELYNNRKELRNYEIELEGLPRTWTSQSRKQVSLNSGERSTEYIYFTPEREGDYVASLNVRSGGEEVYSETIDISSGGVDRPESLWTRIVTFLRFR